MPNIGHPSGTWRHFKSNMEDEEMDESHHDRGEIVSFTCATQDSDGVNAVHEAEKVSGGYADGMPNAAKENALNNTSQNCASGDAHVRDMDNNKLQTTPSHASAPVNSSNSPGNKLTNDTKSPGISSPETLPKRRRVNHDYRLLSSSGYVDDYERSGKDRFTIANEKDTDILVKEIESPIATPSPVKAMTSPVFTPEDDSAESGDSDEYGKFSF